jgi:type IV pilus assembly protein PilN
MIRINLLSADRLSGDPRRAIPRRRRGEVVGSLFLILSVSGAAARLWQLRSDASAIDGQISRTQAELGRLATELAAADSAAARKSELSGRLTVVDRLRSAQQRPVTLLLALSRSLPDAVWLTELKQQGPVVQIEGRATAVGAVSEFVERLQESGAFDGRVEILSIGRESLERSQVIRFAVKARTSGT